MMKIVHIGSELVTEEPKKLTKKQQLHEDAVLAIANATIKDRERAKEMFVPEREEVQALKRELEFLTTPI